MSVAVAAMCLIPCVESHLSTEKVTCSQHLKRVGAGMGVIGRKEEQQEGRRGAGIGVELQEKVAAWKGG